MIKAVHNIQIILLIVILAISFFISYDFFITNISYKRELFLISSVLLMFVAAIKYMLRLQFYFFVQKRVKSAEIKEMMNKKGKSRVFVYESLLWVFMLALSLFQLKMFGSEHSITVAYFFTLIVDIFFWLVFQKKFKNIVFNNQIFLFNSRPDTIGLKNIRKITHRYNDYYLNYKDRKFKLLKTDLISDKIIEKLNASA